MEFILELLNEVISEKGKSLASLNAPFARGYGFSVGLLLLLLHK